MIMRKGTQQIMGVTHSKEYQNITAGLSSMNLEHSGNGGTKVVCFWLRCIVDIDRELTARN
jgi:hypothetical protein